MLLFVSSVAVVVAGGWLMVRYMDSIVRRR